jgi:hypothetical protein
MLDIDGTLVKETSQVFDEHGHEDAASPAVIAATTDTVPEEPVTSLTSAELYGEKMNLSNYVRNCKKISCYIFGEII